MVDMLVESSNNVEMILKFFDMFLKLKDLTSSDAFKEYDPDGKGKAPQNILFLHICLKNHQSWSLECKKSETRGNRDQCEERQREQHRNTFRKWLWAEGR